MRILNTKRETLESLHDALISYNVFFSRYFFFLHKYSRQCWCIVSADLENGSVYVHTYRYSLVHNVGMVLSLSCVEI